MSSILILTFKDLTLIFRDKAGLFWILAFPLLYTGFFGMVYGGAGGGGGSSGLSIALVDEDRSSGSAALIAELLANDSLKIARQEEDQERPALTDMETARMLVRKGKRVAFVQIPPGFGDHPFAIFSGETTARLRVGVDPTRSAEAGFLQGILTQCAFKATFSRFGDRDLLLLEIKSGREALSAQTDLIGPQKLLLNGLLSALGTFVEGADLDALALGGEGGGMGDLNMMEMVEVQPDGQAKPASAFEISLPQGLVWGLMGVALGFAVSIVRERTKGTLLRLRTSPLSLFQLFAGKALACLAGCMLTMTFLIGVGVLAFNVRIGSPRLLLLGMLATSFCFTGIMMLSSIMGRTEQAVTGAAWGAMMPFAMVGGGMIPLVAMPAWLVTASDYSPFKWAILALEGAIWRDFAPADMLQPCLILVASGLAFYALGLLGYRRVDA